MAPREACIRGTIDKSALTPREALAVELAERMAFDPHAVDDAFWAELRQHFSEEELVELVFAAGIFNWGNKFNITMRMDAAPDSPYGSGMEYQTLPVPARP